MWKVSWFDGFPSTVLPIIIASSAMHQVLPSFHAEDYVDTQCTTSLPIYILMGDISDMYCIPYIFRNIYYRFVSIYFISKKAIIKAKKQNP